MSKQHEIQGNGRDAGPVVGWGFQCGNGKLADWYGPISMEKKDACIGLLFRVLDVVVCGPLLLTGGQTFSDGPRRLASSTAIRFP